MYARLCSYSTSTSWRCIRDRRKKDEFATLCNVQLEYCLVMCAAEEILLAVLLRVHWSAEESLCFKRTQSGYQERGEGGTGLDADLSQTAS